MNREIPRKVEVVEYNPEWPRHFCRLRKRIWPAVEDLAVSLEHVGSTSVPGLAGKPVIDVDLVISSRDLLAAVIARLAGLGYRHRGDLGIADREAFAAPPDQPKHHLYVCPADSVALRNHLALRDHLRACPADVLAYGALKKDLANRFPHDMDRYIAGKTDFILSILSRYGFGADRLESIRRANQG